MLNVTINTWPNSLDHYTNDIKDQNACERLTKIVCFISLYVARLVDYSLVVVSGKLNAMSDILIETGIKCRKRYLPYQIVGSGGRFLLTKQAFFYSIDVLESTIYNRLLFLSLKTRITRISGKKPDTEDTGDFIGISKLKTAVRFGRVNFLEIVRC